MWQTARFLAAPRTTAGARRRGSIYIFVLATAMLLTIIGLSAVTLARVGVRANVAGNDSAEAEVLAENAVEYALGTLNANPTWRTVYTSGTESAPQTLGGGTISFKLVDEADGNLANNTCDPVRIYGFGKVRNAVRIFSVQARNDRPLACLKIPLTVNSTIQFGPGTTYAGGATVASNASIDCGSATIFADIEAVGSIDPRTSVVFGKMTSGVPPRAVPDAKVFEYYKANGTAINIGSVPAPGGIKTIGRQLLSPANNPFGGATNAQGIYVIDCQGQKIFIQDSRIVATLVLLNTGGGSAVQGSINWTSAVTNYPCLLVQGDMRLLIDGPAPLSETLLTVNFNPPGTPYPYPSGTANLVILDAYPSTMPGLVYVSGNVIFDKFEPTFSVLVVGGTLNAMSSTQHLNYSPTFYGSPPPGFTTAELTPVSGSWRWEKAP